MFQIIGYIDKFTTYGNTQHVIMRSKRAQIAQRLINEESAKVCKIAIVNRGHINGYEIHIVYNNGVVKVYNQATSKYITCLIARLPQITRYGIKPTKTMQAKVKRHVALGYNEM